MRKTSIVMKLSPDADNSHLREKKTTNRCKVDGFLRNDGGFSRNHGVKTHNEACSYRADASHLS
jgi:hypothetical protein